MKIIRFSATNAEIMQGLKQRLLTQINVWSRLQRLSEQGNDTQPFNDSIWKEHPTMPDTVWANWDDVYNNLGDDGRLIADQFLGDGQLQGVLLEYPMIASMPETQLVIETVGDDFWQPSAPEL